MTINTEYVAKSIKILEKSYELLLSSKKSSIEYEIYRNSTIKCFEVTLEQIGKLLRKKIKPYFSSAKEVDRLNYKDIFRHALKHGILTDEMVKRWFIYRDNRNDTAHDFECFIIKNCLALVALYHSAFAKKFCYMVNQYFGAF